MSHTLNLPDEVYQALVDYARELHQTPEEAVRDWVRHLEQTTSSAAPTPTEPFGTAPEAGDPWEGFRGHYQAKYPDLIERHDYYLGQEALATHEGADDEHENAEDAHGSTNHS